MTRPTKNPLTRQVVEHLQALIFERGLTEGDELPSQAELAATLGVSRLVVREATRTLEAQGLVRAEQGRKLTVGRPDARQLGQLFSLMVRSNEAALLELLEVRRALELHFARLAAENATTADIQAMQRAIDDLRSTSARSIQAQADADGAFHEALANAAANRFMPMLNEALQDSLRELRIRSLKGSWARLGSLDHVIRGHEAILACVVNRDAEGVVRAMTAHLADTWVDLQYDESGATLAIHSA